MKKFLFIVLAICFCLTAVSCKSKDEKTETLTAETRPIVSADEAGIVSHGFVKETEFPAIERLTEWYAGALPLETVPGALIYSKDDTDRLWHCWVYLGAQGEHDALSLRAVTDGELCVILDYTDDTYNDAENLGAYYFTVESDTAPDFDLLINGEDEGLIVTHADVSVARS